MIINRLSLSAILLSGLFFGCGEQNYTNDLTLKDDASNIPKEERVVVDITGLKTTALEFKINNDVYNVYEDGLFDRYFTTFYDIALSKDPEDTRCNLFDYQNDSSVIDNKIECYPSEIPYQNTAVKVGEWTYNITGDLFVLYSSEAIEFDENNTVSNTTNAGLFIDDNRLGNYIAYIADEKSIDGATNPYDLHDILENILNDISGVSSVTERYLYDSYPQVVTKEYLVTFDKGIKAADVLKRLTDDFKDALHADKLQLQPHTTLEAKSDVDMVVAVDIYYYTVESTFYQFRITPLSVMGSNNHFPTLDVGNSKSEE